MARHPRSAVGTVHASAAWHLLLFGMVFASLGGAVLVTGVMQMPSPAPSPHWGWTHSGSDFPTAHPHARLLPSSAGHRQKTQSMMRMLPASPLLAAIAPQLLHKTSEDWIISPLFACAPSDSGQHFPKSESMSASAAPVEEQDLRQDLLVMAAAQHAGHWISACPCAALPVASPPGPNEAPTSGPR